MIIRPATSADVPQLAELSRRQMEHQQEQNPSFQLRPEADYPAFVRARLDRADRTILLADSDGSLVGYVMLRIVDESPRAGHPDRWWKRFLKAFGRSSRPHGGMVFEPRRFGFVEDWYVVPATRQQGVGGRLLAAGLTWFQARNVRDIEATVWSNNRLGQAAFRQLGFEPVRLLLRKQLP